MTGHFRTTLLLDENTEASVLVRYSFTPGRPAHTPRGELAPTEPPEPPEVEILSIEGPNGEDLDGYIEGFGAELQEEALEHVEDALADRPDPKPREEVEA